MRRRKGSDAAASAHGSQANGDGKAEDDADNVLALSDAGEGRPGSDDDEEGDARDGDDEAKAAAKAAPEEATGGDVPESYRLPYHVRAPLMDVCTGLGKVEVCRAAERGLGSGGGGGGGRPISGPTDSSYWVAVGADP